MKGATAATDASVVRESSACTVIEGVEDRGEQEQQDDHIADAASFPSLEEQNQQRSEAIASLQQQQLERRRLQQQQHQQNQQHQQQEQSKDVGRPEADPDIDAVEDTSCSYCGISGTDILLRCATCYRYFCNSTGHSVRAKGPSHIVHHIIKSKHREVRFHPLGSLGGTKLECFVCGAKNVLQLGMVVAEGREVVVIVCRDKCYAGGVLEANGWDPTQWEPLIEKKAFAPWLVRTLTKKERSLILPLSYQEMEQLEERWAKDGSATIADIRAEGNEPLPSAALAYEDGVSYQRTYAPLVQAEGDVDRIKTLREIAENVEVTWEKDRFDRMKAYFILEDDRFSGDINVAEELKLFCRVPRALLKPARCSGSGAAGAAVVDTVTVDWSAKVWVTAVSKLSGLIEAVVSSSSHGKAGPWDSEAPRTYSVQRIWNSVVYERMAKAIFSFAADDRSICPYLFNILLAGTDASQELKTELPDHFSAPNLPPLNHSQIEAIRLALQHRLTLIQGPPGTGKTLTAATLVYQLWTVKPKGNAILVAAPSNVAVDNLAERIHLTGLRVVRVYSRNCEVAEESVGSAAVPLAHLALHKLALSSPSAKSEELLMLRRKKSKEGDLSPKDERRLKSLVFKCELEVLSTADVVCCTCIGAGDKRFDHFDYKTVVIDESTQATEPQTLVPLVMGANHVVLIGDHRQLGPVLTSKRAQASGLGIPLFVRMLLLNVPSFRLSVQYRMHPSLSYFPSHCYYDGALQNGVTSSERTFSFAAHGSFRFDALCSAKEELSSTGTSYVNRGEASVVERLIAALIRGGAHPDQIGVITPYIGQRNYIKTLLQRNPIPAEVELSSVDAFQGREKDIIIFSCVRSNDEGTIGFLADSRRVNVALTRARYCLFICGNADLLSVNRTPRKAPSSQNANASGKKVENRKIEEAPSESCELLELASATFLKTFSDWSMLLMHYNKKKCIVTGPICNLRSVGIVQRGKYGSTNESTNAVVSWPNAACASSSVDETTKLTKVSNAVGVPDYPLSQEAALHAASSAPAEDDGKFTGSCFDI